MAKPVKRRVDPKPRRAPDGVLPLDKLRGADPKKHYVYVSKAAREMGPDYYESIGYAVERAVEGGVRSAAGKIVGEGAVIEVMGCVLMSISLEDREKIEQFGIDGVSGQRHIDDIEKKIVKPGGVDGLRGMHGAFEVLNETARPTVEFGT